MAACSGMGSLQSLHMVILGGEAWLARMSGLLILRLSSFAAPTGLFEGGGGELSMLGFGVGVRGSDRREEAINRSVTASNQHQRGRRNSLTSCNVE